MHSRPDATVQQYLRLSRDGRGGARGAGGPALDGATGVRARRRTPARASTCASKIVASASGGAARTPHNTPADRRYRSRVRHVKICRWVMTHAGSRRRHRRLLPPPPGRPADAGFACVGRPARPPSVGSAAAPSTAASAPPPDGTARCSTAPAGRTARTTAHSLSADTAADVAPHAVVVLAFARVLIDGGMGSREGLYLPAGQVSEESLPLSFEAITRLSRRVCPPRGLLYRNTSPSVAPSGWTSPHRPSPPAPMAQIAAAEVDQLQTGADIRKQWRRIIATSVRNLRRHFETREASSEVGAGSHGA